MSASAPRGPGFEPRVQQAAAQRRNADRRRCPKCGRGAALVRVTGGTACRWGMDGKCDYVRMYES